MSRQPRSRQRQSNGGRRWRAARDSPPRRARAHRRRGDHRHRVAQRRRRRRREPTPSDRLGSETPTTTTTTGRRDDRPRRPTATTADTRAAAKTPAELVGARAERRRAAGRGPHDVATTSSSRSYTNQPEPSRLGRARADREHRAVQGRPRPGSGRARNRGRRRARRSQPFPDPPPPGSDDRRLRRRRRRRRLTPALELASDRASSRSRSGPVAMSIAVHAIAERAFEHRPIGRRVDARGRELGLVVHRAGASRSPMHGWIDGIASETLPMSVENVIALVDRRRAGRASCAFARYSVDELGVVLHVRVVGRDEFDRRARRRLRARRPRSSDATRGRSVGELVVGAARAPSRGLRCARGRCSAASPPWRTTPCTCSPGRRCWRSSPIATCATVNASPALTPSSGAAAACDSWPV